MFLKSFHIDSSSLVSEIVKQDYRTADVFRKYEIEYCCGGNWPLDVVCKMKGIDISVLQKELYKATRNLQLPGTLPFNEWSIDFLTDYIIHIHHTYLRKSLPEISVQLKHFADEHLKKHPYLSDLQTRFTKLHQEIIPHLLHEEEIVFPYICQVAHAYENKDPFAGLLVKTLRKPIDKLMDLEHGIVAAFIYKFRELTNNYIPPAQSCTNHYVLFAKLAELDNDLVQHMYLENDILFPRALAMEKELLYPG